MHRHAEVIFWCKDRAQRPFIIVVVILSNNSSISSNIIHYTTTTKSSSSIITMKFSTSAVAFACLLSAASARMMKHPLQLEKLPDSGEPWTTLEDGTEFQPAANLSPLAKEHLRRLTEGFDEEAYTKIFVDGAETYYDEMSQAWRALGFYIDCDYTNDHRRELQDDGSGCRRFMLWAGYVDENYSGHGVGEYQYYDRKNNRWDDVACKAESSSPCTKMDCHLPETSFSLIGFFKEPNWGEWMEQLFKHEGDCVWTDEEYRFMQGNREVWPRACTATSFETSAGLPIYYDLMPMKYGEMDIGLYTDANCIEQYTGSYTAEDILRYETCYGDGGNRRFLEDGEVDLSWLCSNNYTDYQYGAAAYKSYYGITDNNNGDRHEERGNLWSLEDSVERWNDAFDVYKQCQPCKTYDLTSYVAGNGYQANSNGDRYEFLSASRYKDAQDDHDDGDDEDNEWHCHDAAGYDNVNQCMKFKTKTRMMTASWKDIELAAMQGSVVTMQVPHLSTGDYYDGMHKTWQASFKSLSPKSKGNWSFIAAAVVMAISSILFGVSLFRYVTTKEDAYEAENSKVPLVANDAAVQA